MVRKARVSQPERLNVKQALAILLEGIEMGEVRLVTENAENAAKAAREALERMRVHHSSESGDWMTPQDILDRAVRVLGSIELDPAAEKVTKAHPERNVPAARHFDGTKKALDGLVQPWAAKTVFLNPPYGRVVGKWVEKAASEYESGNTGAMVVLLAARTDTKWFARLDAYPRCYVRGRLRFSGCADLAPFPSAVFLLSDDWETFEQFGREFGELGMIVGTVTPRKKAA